MALGRVNMERLCPSVTVILCILVLRTEPVRADVWSAVVDARSGKISVLNEHREGSVAWANFTDDIQNSGWAFLEVTTSSQYNDSLQAYLAGAVEGAATSQLIYKHWMNTLMNYCGPFASETTYCERLKAFITANLKWVQEQIQSQPNSPYWYQLGGDLEDLESALNKSSQTRPLGSGSCSALIKLLPNNKDLLVAHDTWNNYQSMLRIMKKYMFAFSVSPLDNFSIPGETQAFSSYPGSIFSGDDFYILSSGLVTLETTIGNSNPALWKFVQPAGSVMEWLRNIVANRLSVTAKDWAEIFSRYNSGTYNNQWMIVDYNRFSPGRADIKEELFVVLEQIPGKVVYADKTQELLKTGYWASFNIPYFVEIFNTSGCNELVEKYGPWFSLDQNPRAQIFRRNQSDVTDLDSMVRLMRYNNFKEDPLSWCETCDPQPNGENSISARSDLNPANGTYPFGALHQRSHGGTDMKLTSYGMFRQYEMLAVNGPTWDQLPPFQWSTSPYKDLLHMGHPDRWAFKPIQVTWAPFQQRLHQREIQNN